jgi:5-methylcytosine-specific restriction endonuclease McrA
MCSTTTNISSHRHLEELEREICELAAHIAAATCRWLLLVAEFDERLGWADWGARSCAQWLSWRCSIGRVAAREHVRVARRLGELPLVREAFAAGELTYCKARAITRVATPEIEESLVELARHATGAQLEKLVRSYGGAMAATTESAQQMYELRGLRFRWEDDGSLRLEGRLPPDEGALVLSALKAAQGTSEVREDASAEAPAPNDGPAARRADALVSIARSALIEPATSSSDGDPCELVVHVDVHSLVSDRVEERCELEDGPAIAPETVRRLGCEGSVVRIIERDGRPLSVGRRKRTVSPALRRALRSRDEGCRFPGCTHKRFLHAHHIHHWARGGPTTLDNLIQLCSYHHRLVHEGGFCVEHAGKRGVRFRRPDGRLITQANTGRATCGPGVERQDRVRGLSIGAETCRPRSLGDPLDYGIAVEVLLAKALATPEEANPAQQFFEPVTDASCSVSGPRSSVRFRPTPLVP